MTKSNPKRTEPSTQPLPTTPTILTAQEMETWGKTRVLQWIQERTRNILKGDNLEKFRGADITGTAFLLSNFKFFKSCALSPGVSLILGNLVDEVKNGGKFIPST